MTCQMNKYPGFAGLCIGLESCFKHKYCNGQIKSQNQDQHTFWKNDF